MYKPFVIVTHIKFIDINRLPHFLSHFISMAINIANIDTANIIALLLLSLRHVYVNFLRKETYVSPV